MARLPNYIGVTTGRSVRPKSEETDFQTFAGLTMQVSRLMNRGLASLTIALLVISCSETTSTPDIGDDAPEPGTGDVILVQDNFNRATLAELLDPWTTDESTKELTTGRTGNAIRFPFRSGNTGPVLEESFPETTDIYFRYWYRLSPGADPTCGGRGESGFKWFMPWRRVGSRYTMGVGDLRGGPAGFENTGLEFSSHDNSSDRQPDPFVQNINKSKTFKTTADGAWHQYTLHVVTGTGGYEQIWIDGVLVLDNRAYNYDHDAEGIYLVKFPGNMVEWYDGCDFTLDIDDFVIWRK
jgi:hypothetical protein